MKPRIVLLLLMLLQLSMLLEAQVSEIDQMLLGDGYMTKNTIVRQYDAKFNLVMVYGHDHNTVSGTVPSDHSSFYLRDANNGYTMHVVTLPDGYKVNDVKFVSLTRLDNHEDIYCCFCGTFYHYVDTYAIVEPPDPRTQYFYYYDTMGFVGYFKMEEAFSSNNTYTAKIRNIELAKELDRMICYDEFRGGYVHNQNTYHDNAVLDIIGVPEDTVNAKSALWRVKFYPEYPDLVNFPSGTRWDNSVTYEEPQLYGSLPIIKRFGDIQSDYPVSFVNFNPYQVENEVICSEQ